MEAAHQTNWLPGFLVLGAALLSALVFLFNARRKHLPTAAPSSALDLEARYQSLIAQLKEHSAGRHLHPPEAWAAEQARLEQAAAAVLRERDGVKHDELKAVARAEKKAQAAAPAGTGFFARYPQATVLWGGGVVLFFVVLGMLLSKETSARQDGMEATGNSAPGAGPMQGNRPPPQEQEDPELKTAIERARRSPEDIDALANAAKQLIRRQLFDDAVPFIQQATALDPHHVPTRINRAVLGAVQGDGKKALDELVHVAQTFEEAHDARLFAGMLALQNDDRQTALEQLERYVAEAPRSEQPPMIPMAIAQLKQELAAPTLPPKAP